VREGYRNKEIAAALFISLRTVELRLTHIYRKVGARSRSHLAALLG
jgi:DNA-binding NarL/FixJ family response regulator